MGSGCLRIHIHKDSTMLCVTVRATVHDFALKLVRATVHDFALFKVNRALKPSAVRKK